MAPGVQIKPPFQLTDPQQFQSSTVSLSYTTSFLWSKAQDACFVGNRIYSIFPLGLLVLDSGSLNEQSVVNRLYEPSGYGGGIVARNNRAYWAAGNSGLRTVDVTTVDSPSIVSVVDSLSADGYLEAVFFTSDSTHLVTAASFPFWGYVDFWSLANPDAPEHVASIFLPGWPVGLDIDSSRLFVTYQTDYGYSGLGMFDISDPADPHFVSGLPEGNYTANGVDADGAYVYLALGYSGLNVLALDSNQSLVPTAGYVPGGWVEDVVKLGSTGYVFIYGGIYGGGMHTIDLSDPGAPVLLDTFAWSRTPASISESLGRMLLVDGYYDGIRLVDISDAASPELLSHFKTPGFTQSVALSDSLVIVASYPGSFRVADISDPETPRVIVGLDSLGTSYSADFSAPFLYVASGYDGITVVDLSDTAMPQVVSTLDSPGRAFDLQVSGEHLYVADADEGLQVYSLAQPANPQWLAGLNLNAHAIRVVVRDSLAYVGTGELYIVNVSDPSEPALLGHYAPSGEFANGAVEIYLRGTYCFLPGNYGDGVDVLDVSDPSQPQFVAGYGGFGRIAGFALWGDFAFVASDTYDPSAFVMHVVNTYNVRQPVFLDSLALGGKSGALLALSADHLLVSHDGGGQSIYEVTAFILRGDANGDGRITAADIVYLVNFVFKSGPAPSPQSAEGDANCDGSISAADIIYLVNYVFKGGPAPACQQR